MKRKKILESLWKKHPQCRNERCRKGYVKELRNNLCGSQGVATNYCPTCVQLWKDRYFKILDKSSNVRREKNHSPEEMIEFVIAYQSAQRNNRVKRCMMVE